MKIETPILKRLGPVPYWRGETRCLDALETMYRRAAEKAKKLLSAADSAVLQKRKGEKRR